MASGIDYGKLAGSNRDPKTGIHYGILSAHDLPFWWDTSEPYYGETLYCPACGEEGQEGWEYCPIHGEELTSPEEPIYSGLYQGEGILAHSGEGGEVWFEKSPFYTFTNFCSPCAPGAGDLNSPCGEEGAKTYCPPPTWFEDDKPPFDVFSVKDGSLVVGDSNV